MTLSQDDAWAMATGARVIDLGGLVSDEDDDVFLDEDYISLPNLIIFAIDPGVTSGWAALKVPTGLLLSGAGVVRTLVRCRWRHGSILRPAGASGSLGDPVARLGISDSKHVSLMMAMADRIYNDWVYEVSEQENWDYGWEDDVFVLVCEGFTLRTLSMDSSLLAPVRFIDRMLDRMWMGNSDVPLYFQSASDAKRTVTDQRLRSWSMYDRHSGVHARDADRHAILFLRRFAESEIIRKELGFPV